jgi:hypothetical protein
MIFIRDFWVLWDGIFIIELVFEGFISYVTRNYFLVFFKSKYSRK